MRASSGRAVALSFLTSAVSAANQTTYTFSSLSFGNPIDGRILVLGIGGQRSAAAPDITSVTIGGVTATERLEGAAFSTENRCWIYTAEVPSGSSGDVVVTFSAAMVNAGIGLWRAVGIDPAPHDTLTDDTGSPVTGTIDVPARGICVAHCYCGGGPVTWAGLDEDYDDTGLDAREQSGASKFFGTLQSGLTVSATITTPAQEGMAVASFGPR